jgi:acylphosphatase
MAGTEARGAIPVRSVSDDRSRVRVTVRGSVQGVGFRAFVQRVARGLDLDGWVANRADGAVDVVAEGPGPAIDRLVERLRQGPPAAWVRDIDIQPESPRGEAAGFAIRSGAHRGD